ncbi:MAG TPA: diaminopimelate decarboxylase [Caldisericia bacterium]|nr:diaminopimelate decarboxylase [Caldisericia bacterium]
MQDISLINSISSKFGTPVYIYWEEIIIEQIQKILNLFSGINFSPTYAVKANFNPKLLELIWKNGFGMEVASIGELFGVTKAHIKLKDVIWNSNCKTKEEMKFFLDSGVGRINIDSIEELKDWIELFSCNSFKNKPKFYLRINPNISVDTHNFIKTGLITHKFGIPINSIPDCIDIAKREDFYISGLHIHLGSQITEIEPFVEAFEEATLILKKFNLNEINIGGGFGINYTGNEINLNAYRQRVVPILKDFKVIAEFGRFIVGESSVYLTKVIRIKHNGAKTFVVVDGGMNHLIRPALYGAVHPFKIIGKTSNVKENYDIVGPICESGDVLYRNATDFLPEKGSLIAFCVVGAYGFSMANHYNGYPLPPEVLVHNDGSIELIRTRETFNDLYRGVK